MKNPLIRITSALLSLIMIIGVLAVIPVTASASATTTSSSATAPTVTTTDASVWDGTSKSTSLAGSGTEDDPYLIGSANDFRYFLSTASSAVAGTVYRLTRDIDMDDVDTLSTQTRKFAGILDGDGHSIVGLYATGRSTDTSSDSSQDTAEKRSWGIFKYFNGTLKNISIRYRASGEKSAAFIVYTNGATFQNVHMDTDINDKLMYFGGIVYRATDTTFENVTLTGTVKNTRTDAFPAGGLTAWAKTTTFTNCVNYASVSSSSSRAGGFAAGSNGGVSLTSCVNYGDVYGVNTAGGLIGRSYDPDSITNPILTINNCTNYGAVSGTKQLGGLVGMVDSVVTINNSANHGTVTNKGTDTTNNQTGGLVGKTTATLTMTGSTNYGSVTNAGNVGGLLGETTQALTVDDCANYASVTTTKASCNAGGMIGYIEQGIAKNVTITFTFNNCVNMGNIISTAASTCVGGFIGGNKQGSDINNYVNLTLNNCAQYGNVRGANAGGVVGFYNIGHADNVTPPPGAQFIFNSCLFKGSVEGTYCAGGIVGYASPNNWTSGPSSRHIDMFFTNCVVASTRTVAENVSTQRGAMIGYVQKTDDSTGNDIFTFTNSYVQVGDGEEFSHRITTVGGWKVNGAGENGTNVWYNEINGGDVTAIIGYVALPENALTSGSALTTLNGYATANSLPPWVQGKEAPLLLTTLGFSGATMSLGGNMALNMKLDASTLAGLDILHITFVDVDTNVGVQATIDESGYYSVSYDKRAADMAENMNMRLVVTLKNGTSYRSTMLLTYSPAKYLTNLYEDYRGEKKDDEKAASVLDVVTNMLAYGAESEAKRDGIAFEATETAKAAETVGIILPETFPYTSEHTPGVMTSADTSAINGIALTGASLTGSISVTFQMTNTGYTILTVNGRHGTSTYNARDGYIIFEDIPPTQILTAYQLVFSGEGVPDVTANFCVGDFLEGRRQANIDNDAYLAAATIRYMMSVRAYSLGQDPIVPAPAVTHTVTFDAAGGTDVTAQTIIEGRCAIAPTVPTRKGYTFVAWTLNGEEYDFSTPVTGDIQLVATWEEKVERIVTLHKDFIGGNVRILSQDGDTYHIQNELRDSPEWIYWSFCVEDAGGKTLTFTFDKYDNVTDSLQRIGRWGPAISHDLENWSWLGNSTVVTTSSSVSFTYTFAEGEDTVYFAHNMLYHPARFEKFAAEKGLEIKELCKSKAGASVPYVTIGEGEQKILIVARHHACESTGDYVLEGILEEFLRAGVPEGYQVIAIPFMDYDGVIAGDQGKSRQDGTVDIDYNHDYRFGVASVHPETAAVKKMAEDYNILYAFDLHSPWHTGNMNDTVFGTYSTGNAYYTDFWNMLQANTAANPNSMQFSMQYTTQNGTAAPTQANVKAFRLYMEAMGAKISLCLETTFFGLSGNQFTQAKGIELGKCFAETILDCLPVHTVTFLDKDGGIMSVQTIPNSMDAVLPTPPAYAGFVFTGWSASHESISDSITIQAQYKEISSTASTMNVVQWQQNVAPSFSSSAIGADTNIVLYTGDEEITSAMIPSGWAVVPCNSKMEKFPNWSAVLYNAAYYTYDETAGKWQYTLDISEAGDNEELTDNVTVLAVPLVEKATGKQFVMTIFVVKGLRDGRDAYKTAITGAMSHAMQNITAKYPQASGIMVSFQAHMYHTTGNKGLGEYLTGMDATAFVSGYDLVSHYEAQTFKNTANGFSRDYATYLLTYMKEGQTVAVNAETLATNTAISFYDGIRSTITFDEEVPTENGQNQ